MRVKLQGPHSSGCHTPHKTITQSVESNLRARTLWEMRSISDYTGFTALSYRTVSQRGQRQCFQHLNSNCIMLLTDWYAFVPCWVRSTAPAHNLYHLMIIMLKPDLKKWFHLMISACGRGERVCHLCAGALNHDWHVSFAFVATELDNQQSHPPPLPPYCLPPQPVCLSLPRGLFVLSATS